MWLTPRRAEGVRILALAVIFVVALALAITFSVPGWSSVLAPDMRLLNVIVGGIVVSLLVSGISKLR